jgi:predicted RNA binding protein with dsRBD fold (UPF0201 family)
LKKERLGKLENFEEMLEKESIAKNARKSFNKFGGMFDD